MLYLRWVGPRGDSDGFGIVTLSDDKPEEGASQDNPPQNCTPISIHLIFPLLGNR